MRLFEKKWRAVHDRVLSSLPDSTRRRLWWLKVTLYPKEAFLEDPEERCSLCRIWSNVEGGINHVAGMPHFRRWCLEHPALAAERWGDAVRQLIAEETLAGQEVVA